MIDPKASFKAEHGKTWPDVVDSPQFHAAVQATVAQMALSMPAASDLATGASYHWRMEGAKQFLAIFMKLADPTPERKTDTNAGLNYKV